MKKTINTATLVAVAALSGCASLPVSTTVVTQPGRRVTAEASKFSVFWLSPLPAETTGQLLDDLLQQCNGADLTGVTIGTQTGWAVIGQVERVIVSGYCVEPRRGGS